MNLTSSRACVCAALCAALVSACGSGNAPPPPGGGGAATPAPVNPVAEATAGTIAGSVTLAGTPPAPEPIVMSSDGYCLRQGTQTTQTFVVGADGAFQNVFVYVKDGLGDLKFPVPEQPVVLDQKGCVYHPRVFGIQVGQQLEILNSDDTLHNVHVRAEHNREFNKGQGAQGVKHTHVFATREVMVPFQCDVHRWMNAWAGVVDHPFYAVTGADGTFRLAGLPPGTYTLEAWHEKLGTQTRMVTVGEKETKDVAFNFST